MISAQEIYTFKKKMLCSSYEVYKGSSLKMARSRSEKPLMEVNLSSLSKKNMAVFEQSQKTPAVYARRQRFTGKSRYEMATGEKTAQLERENFGSKNRVFSLPDGTRCKAIQRGRSFVVSDTKTGETLATFGKSVWSLRKHGVLRMCAIERDNTSATFIFMAVVILIRSDKRRKSNIG
ncbi:hypothetical protein E3Q22_03567 [Wallemia mellicola]|uniref:Tubby C-terminal domain-containing protein n=2 Tax=Wallemia mellicola TaxID=1708541 RepID=A0A4T0U594_9BASI|nr:hypothetical protein E3Q23_03406 [Wallemia mellicola]TIB76398.1 hypothetical protein E3Q22_03567 [Wallemia mellicola]TIB89713.1 hypothetical protein E3Q19_02937 [Wallemia mellicola]TIB95688.1 hypothetical protein E3Q18_03557 [Wallemia mellicola]TIC09179.1 hypothetical protein E3Q14_03518 [Wallemia mellicola]